MTKEELINMMDLNSHLAEALGGLRKSLIAQGFSEVAAESIIVSQLAPKKDNPNE